MTRIVRLDREAEDEIAEAMERYEAARPGLGLEFLAVVGAAMATLVSPGPECGPVPGLPPRLGVRRKLLRRFPYSVVFVVLEHATRVIAVAHGARSPGYWRLRLRSRS